MTENKTLVTIESALERSRPYVDALMPPGREAEGRRIVQLASIVIRASAPLRQCDPKSIVRAVLHCARLGLEPGQLMHFVPYKTQCQAIPDYRGLIELAERSGRVSLVYAEPVYTADTFDVNLGTDPVIVHRPNYETDRSPSDVRAAYAVALRSTGEKQFRVVTKQEIDATKARSKASGKGPWVTDYVAMALKTAVRRLATYLPQSPELRAAVELDNRAEGYVTPDELLDFSDPPVES